jgi:hypothetical protein
MGETRRGLTVEAQLPLLAGGEQGHQDVDPLGPKAPDVRR